MWRALQTLEPNMTTLEARISPHAKKAAPTAPAKSSKTKSGGMSRHVRAENRTASRDEQHTERATA